MRMSNIFVYSLPGLELFKNLPELYVCISSILTALRGTG